MSDLISAFLSHLAQHGIVPSDTSRLVADGRLHRVHVEGDRRTDKNLAYTLHDDDRPSWWFQDHKRGVTDTGSLRRADPPTPQQRAEWAARQAARERETLASYAAAAAEARALYEAATPATAEHPYLARKGLPAVQGLRVTAQGALLVPVYTDFGVLSSLQTIAPDGDKLFHPGGRMQAAFFPIRGADRSRILVCEGVATGIALSQHLPHPVACAMSAGNVPAIVRLMQAKYPESEVVGMADNDHHTERTRGINPGLSAYRDLGVRVFAPPFEPEDPGTDWDDWLRDGGEPPRLDTSVDPAPEPAREPRDRPAPADFFRRQVLPPLRPDHLPPGISDFVFDQSAIVGSDPGILAISALVTLAACIHDEIKIQPRRLDPSWTESARLWGAFVGDPSVKKTPAVKRAISHAKKLDAQLHEESSADLATYLLAEKVHKKVEAEYVKARSAPSGYVPDDAAPRPPAKPPVRRLVVEDTTVEALGVILADNPRGVLVLHDELSGWFGAMDAYRQGGNSGKDRAHWLEAYNGGPKRIDRLSRTPLLVPNWSVCVLGGIQPSAIRKIAAGMAEDGLMQRFMIVMASEQDGLGEDRVPDLDALQRYRDIMDHLFNTAPSGTPVRLSPECIAIREDLESEMKQLRSFQLLPARFRAALGKWDGLFPRLVLLYHCIAAAQARRHPSEMPVSPDTCRRVRSFMREYLFGHALAFYADVLEDSDRMEHVKWIAGHILARELYELTSRDLQRAYPKWRSLPRWTQEEALRVLEDGGWLTPDAKNLGKRTTRWTVTAEVHVRFAKLAEQESERRAALRERLASLRQTSTT